MLSEHPSGVRRLHTGCCTKGGAADPDLTVTLAPFGCFNTSQWLLYERGRRCPRHDGCACFASGTYSWLEERAERDALEHPKDALAGKRSLLVVRRRGGAERFKTSEGCACKRAEPIRC
ncbi:MAG: hypothetical protein LBK25_06450 [Treponema sp.]|nr:hypothetical protein [Treponema sp.]